VPRLKGFDLIDYDEARGLDAEEWIPRLQAKGYPLKYIWLPQDAKVKTFQSRHSSLEQFIRAFGMDKVGIVPATKKHDQINAARIVIARCRFHRTRCKLGLAGLREWAVKYDEEKKNYSKEPEHDWASHPADGFAYGAVIMQEQVMEQKKKEKDRSVSVYGNTATLDDLWDTPKQQNWRI
jgi:phage terminase large subunit